LADGGGRKRDIGNLEASGGLLTQWTRTACCFQL
jgi:hypothetical protein